MLLIKMVFDLVVSPRRASDELKYIAQFAAPMLNASEYMVWKSSDFMHGWDDVSASGTY